jgi:ribosomal protein L37AE/L43A
MQIDPVQEWQRLAEEYRQKSEGELLELARDFGDLTETAQQALRAEMRSRGLGDPEAPRTAPGDSTLRRVPRVDARVYDEQEDTVFRTMRGPAGNTPEPASDGDESVEDEAEPHDYTWLTYLCECQSREQAAQLCEVLRRAEIDCRFQSYGLVYPRVLVAADQLDQARAIAAKPIPSEVIDDSKVEFPEYVVPKCPKCGAEDPILEEVEPSNTWRCEQCDAQWTETMPKAEDETLDAAKDSF